MAGRLGHFDDACQAWRRYERWAQRQQDGRDVVEGPLESVAVSYRYQQQ